MPEINARNFVKDGVWFRDTYGRFVLFRGVNFASRSKLPPYIPIAPLQSTVITFQELKAEIELVKPQIKQLMDLGFNIVRVLVMWKAIEPTPNPNLEELLPEGKNYLNMVKEIIDVLYSYGLFVIIDFHQDIAHEIYGGDGFPDWALAIDEFHRKPIELTAFYAIGSHRDWGAAYYINYLVRNTLQSFWKNNLKNIDKGLYDFPVRHHLEKTIGQTVRYFKSLNGGNGHPAILGFSPFNEPHPVGLDKKHFEHFILKQYYSNVLFEINKVDDKSFVFIEPRLDWTIYPAVNTGLDLDQFLFIHDPEQIHTWLPTEPEFIEQWKLQGVFSFHYYDPWTISYGLFGIADNMHNKKNEWPKIFHKVREAAISRGLVPFLTEFGGSQSWEDLITDIEPTDTYQTKQIRAYMDLQFRQVEEYLLNATYWNYDLYNTREYKDNWNFENFSLLGPNRIARNIDIVARTYPRYSSAEPVLVFFDLKTKYSVITLKGDIVEAPTIIYIPYKIHYIPSFKVWASSSRLEWDNENQLLSWWPDKNKDLNQIIITPVINDLDISLLPDMARNLIGKLTFGAELPS
jgi:Cellulase (glycosyl hydrolase family 5)